MVTRVVTVLGRHTTWGGIWIESRWGENSLFQLLEGLGTLPDYPVSELAGFFISTAAGGDKSLDLTGSNLGLARGPRTSGQCVSWEPGSGT